MNELDTDNEKIEKKMDIRIVYFSPATVASSQYIGQSNLIFEFMDLIILLQKTSKNNMTMNLGNDPGK
jgi:hypothetical protein